MVSFFDQYITFNKDPNLGLCFYAQTTLGNERIDKKNISLFSCLGENYLGSYSILKKLNADEVLNSSDLDVAFEIFKNEYFEQYNDRKDGKKGKVEIVKTMTRDDFSDFINAIDWNVVEESDQDLEQEIFNKIRSVDLFDYRYVGKEESILALIYYNLTKNKNKSGFVSKLFGRSDIELIFLKSMSEFDNLDPAWSAWSDIKVNDYRNLKDKIHAVSPIYKDRRIASLYRKLAVAKSEEVGLGKDYISQKIRVLNACSSIVDDFVDEFEGDEVAPEIIQEKAMFGKFVETQCITYPS